MTNEELDEARGEEALQRLVDSGQLYCQEDIATLAARLARESWTPPEPVVDQDVLAYDKWWSGLGHDPEPRQAYLAGARMAREQDAKMTAEEKLLRAIFGPTGRPAKEPDQ